ncbi:acyl-CoA thioesterase [Plectonema cf. radiosum LEGE 06105]|uniref:1,4-dihydroxy-2-naphthoyl-CoA hydrolase n=1 Tax=Plectonema cf. radiosum LEGE 06105 TaxID=945769 RepID=A0A8J7FD26_9CYAN|nr:thioesterase family protein [Plectonema radiosum]MBE9214058.1 acyl-CoA thioesterase [Plectonema cf. radiosum LEGE 06105]
MSFTYNRTIRFQDTDAAGVVYFANVLSICHEAYEAALESLGIDIKQFFTNPSTAFPIVHANVDFMSPMYCGDKLFVSLTPSKIRVEQFEIDYQIYINDKLVGKAITRHVCIDATNRQKKGLSAEIVKCLEKLR